MKKFLSLSEIREKIHYDYVKPSGTENKGNQAFFRLLERKAKKTNITVNDFNTLVELLSGPLVSPEMIDSILAKQDFIFSTLDKIFGRKHIEYVQEEMEL